ncbi:50S ribosomal protein L20 [Patescibacteria group bacterium]|nr:50S ribosomal protein L20 [Patescibacteria group bacterium]MBU1931348.1 50S ribosomal protein L20 [Patescibacteria group bacterium]
MRVKGGTVTKRRHKKILKLTQGYRMTKGRLYRVSKEAALHAGEYAFMGRKLRKRDLRCLWIQRINAALTPFKTPYSQFINQLKKAKIEVNRKMLADLAVSHPEAFKAVFDKANAKSTSKS